jgi:hypothetical protein
VLYVFFSHSLLACSLVEGERKNNNNFLSFLFFFRIAKTFFMETFEQKVARGENRSLIIIVPSHSLSCHSKMAELMTTRDPFSFDFMVDGPPQSGEERSDRNAHES